MTNVTFIMKLSTLAFPVQLKKVAFSVELVIIVLFAGPSNTTIPIEACTRYVVNKIKLIVKINPEIIFFFKLFTPLKIY